MYMYNHVYIYIYIHIRNKTHYLMRPGPGTYDTASVDRRILLLSLHSVINATLVINTMIVMLIIVITNNYSYSYSYPYARAVPVTCVFGCDSVAASRARWKSI